MKKAFYQIIALVGLLSFFAPSLASAQSAEGAEQISRFDVMATIDKDRKVTVEETIEYDFGDYQRHGIYRYIPTAYDRNGANTISC
ncbi:MAG: DUF2207 domain-containing protein [Patescibacteria group bacterium]